MTGLKSAAAAHGQTIPPAQLTQIEGQLLDRLIQVQLLLQKATAADKSNGVQRADLQMKALLERAGSQEVLDRQLKAVGMTPAELRTKVTQESTAQAVLTRELNVTVTDAEVKKFYDDHPADFEQPEMVHVRHILLMTMDPVTRAPLPADQQKAKKKQIDDILKRIRGGADFATLAKQYSEDPGSKDNGGELPPFPRGQMVPEFEAAAFSLTNNQVSDVVTTRLRLSHHQVARQDAGQKAGVDRQNAAERHDRRQQNQGLPGATGIRKTGPGLSGKIEEGRRRANSGSGFESGNRCGRRRRCRRGTGATSPSEP